MVLILMMACGVGADVEAPREARAISADALNQVARHSQEALTQAADTIAVGGELSCEDAAGPWHVRVYSVPLGEQRYPAELPIGEPLAEVVLDEPGAFKLWTPIGARRLVVALNQADPPDVAWSDEYGRHTELRTHTGRLQLNCSIQPTEAPDGSVASVQGVSVPEAEIRPADTHEVASLAWIESVSAAATIGREHIQSVQFEDEIVEDRIRARYRNRLSQEELDVHMPLLYQLAGEEHEADTFVDKVVGHNRRGY